MVLVVARGIDTAIERLGLLAGKLESKTSANKTRVTNLVGKLPSEEASRVSALHSTLSLPGASEQETGTSVGRSIDLTPSHSETLTSAGSANRSSHIAATPALKPYSRS